MASNRHLKTKTIEDKFKALKNLENVINNKYVSEKYDVFWYWSPRRPLWDQFEEVQMLGVLVSMGKK